MLHTTSNTCVTLLPFHVPILRECNERRVNFIKLACHERTPMPGANSGDIVCVPSHNEITQNTHVANTHLIALKLHPRLECFNMRQFN